MYQFNNSNNLNFMLPNILNLVIATELCDIFIYLLLKAKGPEGHINSQCTETSYTTNR